MTSCTCHFTKITMVQYLYTTLKFEIYYLINHRVGLKNQHFGLTIAQFSCSSI